MIKSKHPTWDSMINKNTKKLVIGSMPPDFMNDIESNCMKINYFYGSSKNKFWDICTDIRNINFETPNDCKNFLKENNIGIIDIYQEVNRKDGNASDNNLESLENQDIYKVLLKYPNIKELYFTSTYVMKKLVKELKERDLVEEKYNITDKERERTIKLKDLDRLNVIVLYSPTIRVYSRYYKEGSLAKKLYIELFE